jgi:hypothetical protein
MEGGFGDDGEGIVKFGSQSAATSSPSCWTAVTGEEVGGVDWGAAATALSTRRRSATSELLRRRRTTDLNLPMRKRKLLSIGLNYMNPFFLFFIFFKYKIGEQYQRIIWDKTWSCLIQAGLLV